jgi:sugar lactone lactonase YvrE
MTVTAELFVDCRRELCEGPFWHPLLHRLFWFDILGKELLSATEHGLMVDSFSFDDNPAAAGVIDADSLAIATVPALIKLNLKTNARSTIVPIEADKPGNRTNDSRVNPAGGFWIGTMSKRGGNDIGAGSVYQYRAGKIEKLFGDITIPNSTCFSPDGRIAYFTDTETKRILKRPIDADDGMPAGDWSLFADVTGHRGSPDGSVVDSEGFLWNARFHGSCVVRHAPDGSIDRIVEVPASRVTCPAFGGKDLKTLYITSAWEGADAAEREREPLGGSIFSIDVDVPGLPEPLLKL